MLQFFDTGTQNPPPPPANNNSTAANNTIADTNNTAPNNTTSGGNNLAQANLNETQPANVNNGTATNGEKLNENATDAKAPAGENNVNPEENPKPEERPNVSALKPTESDDEAWSDERPASDVDEPNEQMQPIAKQPNGQLPQAGTPPPPG